MNTVIDNSGKELFSWEGGNIQTNFSVEDSYVDICTDNDASKNLKIYCPKCKDLLLDMESVEITYPALGGYVGGKINSCNLIVCSNCKYSITIVPGSYSA